MGRVIVIIIVLVIIQAVANLIDAYWKWILLITGAIALITYCLKNKNLKTKIKKESDTLSKYLLKQIRSAKPRLYYYFYPEVKKKRLELISSRIKQIESAVKVFREFLSSKTYFDSYLLEEWDKTYRTLILEFPPDLDILLKQHPSYDLFQEFSKYIEHGKRIRTEYNTRYVKECIEQNKEFFDVIEKRPLTLRQREAVVIDDHRNLVLAGAGTGKTSTLVAKFSYLIGKLKVNPQRILMLAFNKDAAEEIRVRTKSRIKEVLHKEIDINVSTFHSFGLQIVKEFENSGRGSVEVEKEDCLRKIFHQK